MSIIQLMRSALLTTMETVLLKLMKLSNFYKMLMAKTCNSHNKKLIFLLTGSQERNNQAWNIVNSVQLLLRRIKDFQICWAKDGLRILNLSLATMNCSRRWQDNISNTPGNYILKQKHWLNTCVPLSWETQDLISVRHTKILTRAKKDFSHPMTSQDISAQTELMSLPPHKILFFRDSINVRSLTESLTLNL